MVTLRLLLIVLPGSLGQGLTCDSAYLQDPGSNTGSFFLPEGCTAAIDGGSDGGCTLAAWWAGISETEYCIRIATFQGEDYVALGFSNSASGMSPAPVIACSSQEAEKVIVNYNEGYASSPAFSNSSIVSSVEVQTTDSTTSCSFVLNSAFSVTPSEDSTEETYDLNENPTFLLLAAGPIADGKLKYHAKRGRQNVSTDLTLNNKFIEESIKCDTDYLQDPDSKTGFFGLPLGCTPAIDGGSEGNCTLAAWWAGFSQTDYCIRIATLQGEDYVALGFSNTAAGMSPAPVIACSAQDLHKVIVNFNKGYASSPAFSNTSMVSGLEVKKVDDTTLCSFVLNSAFNVTPSEDSTEESFDLNTNSTFLLLAAGPINDGKLQYHANKGRQNVSTDLTLNNKFIDDPTFYKNCADSSFGCFLFPSDCDKTLDCTLGANWRGTAEDVYSLQLISKDGDYVAIGFSPSGSMGPAPVLACSQKLASVQVYWNTENYSSKPAFNSSDLIKSYKVEIGKGGDLICDLSISSSFHITPTNSSKDPVEFNLNVNQTHLLLAYGPVDDGAVVYHKNKTRTADLVDLTEHNEFFHKNDSSSNNTGKAIYDGCYQKKGCFGTPNNCVSSKNCEMLITYSKFSEDLFKLELGGESSQDWMAVGLSADKNMGADSVMACIKGAGKTTTNMYYNTPPPGTSKNSLPLDDPQYGLSDITGSIIDNFYSCSFFRQALTSIPIPSGAYRSEDVNSKNTTATTMAPNQLSFDLNNDTYFLLLATGPVDSTSGHIQFHSKTSVSAEAVNLGSFSSVGATGNLLVKLHATSMLIAWFIGACFGTFCARYCKDIFQDKKIMGADLWFRAHQLAMGMCVVLSLLGMVPIILNKGLDPIMSKKYVHPFLGLTVLIIAFFQPIIAYFRPGKDHPWRPIFKLVHTFLGYAAIVISIATVFTAKSLPDPLISSWTQYLVIAFSVWLGSSHLAMTGYQMVKEGEAKTSLEDNPVIKTGLVVFTTGTVGISVAIVIMVIIQSS